MIYTFFCCPCNTLFLSLWVPRVLATRALRSIDNAKNAWSLGLFNFITIHLDGRQWTHPSGFIRPITITTDTGRWWFPLNYLRLFLIASMVFFPLTGGGGSGEFAIGMSKFISVTLRGWFYPYVDPDTSGYNQLLVFKDCPGKLAMLHLRWGNIWTIVWNPYAPYFEQKTCSDAVSFFHHHESTWSLVVTLGDVEIPKHTVDGSEIRLTTWDVENLVNNDTNYLP